MANHLPQLNGANVVVVAPHPDDESLAAGGLLQVALACRAHVSVILLTDGDCNPWPQRVIERRWRIDVADRARWGRRRRAEAERALSTLGVPPAAIHCLGWADMGLTALVLSNTSDSTRILADLLARLMPGVAASNMLVLPSLTDRHPDHGAARVIAELALVRAALSTQLLSYTVHGSVHRSATAIGMDTVSLRRKLAAVEQHHTQLALSRSRMLKYARRPERFVWERRSAEVPTSSSHVLPWDISPVQGRMFELIVATAAGSWKVPLLRHVPSESRRDSPFVQRDGSKLTLLMPDSLRTEGPVFAKLLALISSPWIYDHWGWVRLDAPENRSPNQ